MTHCSTVRRIAFAGLALLLVSATCASAQALARDPASPAGASDARPLYQIGIGDKLDVFEDNSHTACVVRPDRRITFALTGDIDAEGLTPTGLAARIPKALEPHQKDPTGTVAVQEINSHRVYVLGAVNTQQAIQSAVPLPALAAAGGLNEFAKKTIVVMREHNGAPPLSMTMNDSKIVNGDQPEMNIRLESGDMVVME